MASVIPSEQGIASGANNALREVGGALGIAALASVFSAQGGYASPQNFVDGLGPSLWVGAAVVALGAVAAWLLPRRTAAEGAGVTAPVSDGPVAERTPAGV